MFPACREQIKYNLTKKTMNQFKFTPSLIAMLNDGIDGIAQATVRDLCAAHVGKHTQSRFRKEM